MSSPAVNVRSAAAAGLVVPVGVLIAVLVAILIGVLIAVLILVDVLALVGALALVLHEGVLLSCGLLWG